MRIEQPRVALVFRGDRPQRDVAVLAGSRLEPVAAALSAAGLAVEVAVYADAFAGAVRRQLLGVHGVLVWVDPVTGHEDRTMLDGVLRDVAAAGVWVSAHPDVIVKMGTKEVLYRTRTLGWGSDTQLYRSPGEFREAFPSRLASGEARVLKQSRGNGGIGVWKVQLPAGGSRPGPETVVQVQSARARDDTVEEVSLGVFMARCEKYFGYADGQSFLVDQAFQPSIADGLTRCYLVKNEVVGFCRQYPAGRSPKELAARTSPVPPPARVFGLPSAKTMFGPDDPALQSLRRRVETEWLPAMQALVDVDDRSLPALWDADFLFGAGEESYVLSEINVSAVTPFPAQAVPKLVNAVCGALGVTPLQA